MARFHGNKAGASLDTSRLTAMARSIEALQREDGRTASPDSIRPASTTRIAASLLASCARVLRGMQLLGGKERHACETEIAAHLGTRRACSGAAMATNAAT